MENQKKWFEFVARYQGDSEFAAKADADPAGELRRFGVPIPSGGGRQSEFAQEWPK